MFNIATEVFYPHLLLTAGAFSTAPAAIYPLLLSIDRTDGRTDGRLVIT